MIKQTKQSSDLKVFEVDRIHLDWETPRTNRTWSGSISKNRSNYIRHSSNSGSDSEDAPGGSVKLQGVSAASEGASGSFRG